MVTMMMMVHGEEEKDTSRTSGVNAALAYIGNPMDPRDVPQIS